MKATNHILILGLLLCLAGCTGRQNPGDYKDPGTNAPSWSGPVMNRAEAATALVDPPEIKFELTPVGHHYRFQQAIDVSGPWQTVFERQNEYIDPVLRFSMYRTNVQMFYRVEATL